MITAMGTALIILCKAPVAGLAKTRLIPALGANAAAALAERLLAHTVQQALTMPADYRELCVTPSTEHPAFEKAMSLAKGRLHLTLQGEGDLGQRMHRALSRVLGLYSRVLLMGTDAPDLSAEVLKTAADALQQHDAVFVPAHDGGYALVGLTRTAPELFLGMTWSTPQVMQETRERARQISLNWCELQPVSDIDLPADLLGLPAGWHG
jgi:rSAM/selenodomain-associated transferase 1